MEYKFTAACENNNLLIKPENMGTPTMDSDPTENATPAHLFLYPEPVSSMNFLLPPDTSVKPMAAINSNDFVATWEITWKTDAIIPACVPIPIPI